MESTGKEPTRIIDRGELAPAVLLVGDLLIRVLTWAEHIDFLLSVRDEKFANMLELFRDSGWWAIAIISFFWLLYEWNRRRRNEQATASAGSLVFSAVLVSFFIGITITVSATATLPIIIQNYAGDSVNKTCSALLDTSRLLGFQNDYQLVLICGVSDPTIDPQEDTRIAVSSAFHINGGPMEIVTPLGRMDQAWKNQLAAHPGENVQFPMWHTIVALPNGIDPTTINRVSDVEKIGGRILTDPIGGYSSPMVVLNPAPASPPGKRGPKT